MPTFKERKKIWEIHLGLKDQLEQFSSAQVDELAQESDGYSGAEIEQVVASAMFTQFKPGTELSLTVDNLLLELQRTVPLSQSRSSDLDALRKWAQENARSASILDDRTAEEKNPFHNEEKQVLI